MFLHDKTKMRYGVVSETTSTSNIFKNVVERMKTKTPLQTVIADSSNEVAIYVVFFME